jgi:hypothetical protein
MDIKPDKLKDIMEDFTFDTGCTDYDDEFLSIIDTLNNLQQGDRIILSLYAELQSLRKTAAALGVSYTAMRKHINKIKQNFM